MPGSHNFQVFNPTDTANTDSDATYTGQTQRINGLRNGIAVTSMHNKLFKQTSTMVTALAKFMADAGQTVSDTDVNALAVVIKNSVTAGAASAVNVLDTADHFVGTNVESILAELFTFANNGKTAIAGAVNAKGISATSADTFSLLATKIGTASLVNTADATAAAGQILAGLYAYVNGSKLLGIMPENGAVGGTITTQGGSVSIPAGHTSGGSVVANISGLVASVITAPNVVGGITGTAVNGAGMKRYASGTSSPSGGSIAVSGLPFRPTVVRILDFNGTSGVHILYSGNIVAYGGYNSLKTIDNQPGQYIQVFVGINSDGFTCAVLSSSPVGWDAYE